MFLAESYFTICNRPNILGWVLFYYIQKLQYFRLKINISFQ